MPEAIPTREIFRNFPFLMPLAFYLISFSVNAGTISNRSSGAPEHIEGMKDAELIIAINTDPNAPIFDYAHYGVTEDLFDIVPALTEKLKS